MTIRTNRGNTWRVALVLTMALTAASGAFAQQRGGGERFGSGRNQHVDSRFSHNHPYFDRGYSLRERPLSGYPIDHGRDRYWYDRGDWYRRGSAHWVVAGAPVGAFVSILPPFFTTVWFGGAPYYYANDTYYSWNGGRQGYEVVAPPAGIDTAGSTQQPAGDEVFIYPRNGQSSEQQARDRYECHHSAVEYTGYDPTQSGGGVSPEIAANKRAGYFRAQAACLDARGYSVR